MRTAPVPPEGRGTAVPTPVSGATGAAQPDVRVDVETWPDGGVTRSVLVVVRSPGGAVVTVLARWVDPGRGALPVLVLSDVPGPGMWWGVPVAVLQAVTAALAALSPTRTRTAEFLVLGHRPDGTATGELTQLPVGLVDGAPGVLTGRGPRRLPGDEAVQATGALRLRPVPDLLGRLRRVPTGG